MCPSFSYQHDRRRARNRIVQTWRNRLRPEDEPVAAGTCCATALQEANERAARRKAEQDLQESEENLINRRNKPGMDLGGRRARSMHIQ